jgi:myo-inositol-1-phosphate synthase
MKLEVWDSPNSAGVMIDAVRCMKLALENGMSGAIEAPSAYFFKSPPTQYTDDQARRMTEEFIETHSGSSGGKAKAEKSELVEEPTG